MHDTAPSFRPKRSGEISLQSVTSSMVAGDLSTLRFIRTQNPCHPYRRVPPLEMTPPPSFRWSKRSGEISLRNVASSIVAGDLSALRFTRAQSPCTPYRRVPPLEMTMPAGSIQSCPGEKIEQNDALHPRHFDRSEAEWRNLTPKGSTPHGDRRSLGSAFH